MHIYPIDLGDFHKKYVVTAPQDLNIGDIVDKFLITAKMDPKRYAGMLFENILKAFLYEAENIELTYKDYYGREYDNVEEYMYKKMLMEKSEIEYIFSRVKEGEKIYYSDLYYTSDNNYDNLFEYDDENLLMKMNTILEMI
jgi:hypothetical protein